MKPVPIFGLLALALLIPGSDAAPPSAHESTPARIAFGSCALQGAPQPVWEGILSTQPDALILAGDNVYADTEDMDLMRAIYGELGKQPGYQALKAAGPILATWDDHDYGVNDGGSEYAMKKEAKECFLEFFDIPSHHPVRSHPGVYRVETLTLAGLTIQVILLDTRTFRGPLVLHRTRYPDGGPFAAQPDPAVTLLGAAQWAWLGEVLRRPADLRLLVSSIQVVAEDHHWERWANLPVERDRLFALLRDTGANGVIVISGDRHHGELSAMDADMGYRLHDITSSGLNRGWKRPKNEANRHRIGEIYVDDHFGLIEIDTSGSSPVVRLQLRDVEGGIVRSHDVALKELAPGRGGAAMSPSRGVFTR